MNNTICGYYPSKHLLEDRENRLVTILTSCGFGQVIARHPNRKNPGTDILITSTGIILIVREEMKLCLTAFKAKSAQVKFFINNL